MTLLSSIRLNGEKKLKQEAREILARQSGYFDRMDLKEQADLFQVSLGALDRKVKHGKGLTFEEAFGGMGYVLAATNNYFRQVCYPALQHERAIALGVAFLQLMATKEALSFLSAEEIAGMAAAAFIDLVFRASFAPQVFEGCGMGGDKGFGVGGTVIKTINASTLSSLVLASLGVPVVKHGSCCNTSAVGSTSVMERFGACTNFVSVCEGSKLFNATGFFYADAHCCKTLHDLSHLLMMETINHIIGPMTPPIAADTVIHRLMGVNEKVHPATIARAYEILQQRGYQRIGNAMIICGLDQESAEIDVLNEKAVKAHAILDELSPFRSVIAVIKEGQYLGTFGLSPSDFGMTIKVEEIQVLSESALIHEANRQALCGENQALTDFLAMNAALGMFVFKDLHLPGAVTSAGLNPVYLRSRYAECRQAIANGQPRALLKEYVECSCHTS